MKVKHQAENFLNQLWREGALVGNKPEQAYRVMVGLDSTMTVQDVRDGILRMTVALAMLRPAEFILVSVTQTVQKP
jgi:phage tail sheath protein FI